MKTSSGFINNIEEQLQNQQSLSILLISIITIQAWIKSWINF